MRPILPPRLRTGGLIGIVAPASPVSDDSLIERGVRYLERLGYNVIVGRHVRRRHGYLAGTDRERCEDLHTMVRDRRVNAIMALRGGYGSPRLLPSLDYALIARHPKIIVGFSDLTALQLAIWKRCGLVTFHGPMLASDFAAAPHPYTEEMFWGLVSSPFPPGPLKLPRGTRLRMVSPGKAQGRLLGGNLSLLVTTIGTPYQPEFRNGILFIEEIGEEPYRIDRMLMQLRNASAFTRSAAVLTGIFTDCSPADRKKPSLTVDAVLKEVSEQVRKPFLAGLPFGHVPAKLTLPLGVMASVDARARRVSILEPAVA